MFDGAFGDRESDHNDDHADRDRNRDETATEEYQRLVREATRVLWNAPGRGGRLLRMALTSGWS